jgi:hypothetical protein
MECTSEEYNYPHPQFEPSKLRLLARWIKCHVLKTHYFIKRVIGRNGYGRMVYGRHCLHCGLKGWPKNW